MHVSPSRPEIARRPRSKPNISGHALVALALALLTGLTLGQLSLLGGDSFEKQRVRSTVATRTGLEFYDAIGAYLISGQSGELRKLVQPDIVNRIDGQPATNGFAAFLRQVELLRTFVAKTRLSVTPLPSSGDLVRFAVSTPPGAGATVLGLPVTQTANFTFSDVLRVVDGRVAERWSDSRAPVDTELLASTTWDPPPTTELRPAINKLTMLSHSGMTLRLGTAHIILIESGVLTITGLPRASSSSLPEFASDTPELPEAEPVVVIAGSAVVAAGNSPYHIVNDGPTVASALFIRIAGYSLAIGLPASGAMGTTQEDPRLQVDMLSQATSLPDHQGDWTIEIGRATLAPGTIIPQHKVAGSELIVVEAGALDVDLDACMKRCVHTIDGTGSPANQQSSVRTGEGISVSGATSTYRVAGTAAATLLIVTVSPGQE